MDRTSEASASSDGIAVTVTGAVAPWVLLLHGLVASGTFWRPVVDVIAHERRVVVPDLLGFGRSARPPQSGYRVEDHVDAIAGAVTRIGAEAPLLVGAHSMGSVIALGLAARHPALVERIVSFGPPWYPDEATARAHVASTGPMGRLFALPGPVAERACRWVCSHRELAGRLSVLVHPRLPASVAADTVQHSWPSYAGSLCHLILETPCNELLDEISVPLRIVAGRQDPVVDHGHLESIARRYEHVEVCTIEGDHLLPLREPQHCAELLLNP